MVDLDGKIAYSKIAMVKPAVEMLLTMLPNPAHEHVLVTSPAIIKMISIINTTGQVIKTISFSSGINQQEIDVHEIPAGNYFIKAVGENQVWTKQFIKD